MKKKRGPKSKYDEIIYPQLCKWMARSGLTEIQIAAELGISYKQFKIWKQKYKEIGAALKEPKNFVDSLVEDALLKNAFGFEYTEESVTRNGDVVSLKKYSKPDTTAIIFWLKNRQRTKWRNREELEISDNGNLNDLLNAVKGIMDK